MKELSIEEKAKAYDDALERAKMSYHTGDYDKDALEMLEIIFPELKESEDEKMVKFIKQQLFKIKETITENYELDAKLTKAIDWLEKQGEKGINGNEREIPNSEQKPADKVEPKFKVGDKIRRKTPSSCDKDMQVARIGKGYYICNHIGKFSSEAVSFSKESNYELIAQKPVWSEEDKKLINDTCHLINTLASGYGKKVTEPITFSGTKMIANIKDRLRALINNRTQNTWKPSDEQMDALYLAALGGDKPKYKFLVELYIDLEKLR